MNYDPRRTASIRRYAMRRFRTDEPDIPLSEIVAWAQKRHPGITAEEVKYIADRAVEAPYRRKKERG